MWQALLAELLKNVIIPELAEFIKNYYAQNGKLPTREELQARVDSKSEIIVREGTQFLARENLR